MFDFPTNCKPVVLAVGLLICLLASSTVAQPAEPLTGSQIKKNTELVLQQRQIVDAAAEKSRLRLVTAYADLARQREKDEDDKEELARIQKELSRAEVDYRNIVAGWSRAQALNPDTAEFHPYSMKLAYGQAISELNLEVGRAPALLQAELTNAVNDEAEEAYKGASRGGIRAAYLKATVIAEQWAAFEPSVEREWVPSEVAGTPILPHGRYSTLLTHLAWLGERVAMLNPNNTGAPVAVRPSTRRYIVETDRDSALEEFRRLARTGLLVQTGSHKPVEGNRRVEIGKMLETNLQEYVKIKGSQQSDYSKIWHSADDRLRLAQQIEAEIKQAPEYRIAGYLSAGVEPTFKEYFLAAALAVSQSQLDLREKFSREYLGEGFWNTGLGQLLRANDFPGTGDAGHAEVSKRVDKAVADSQFVIGALRAAAFAESAEDLRTSPNRYKLLKGHGYIVEYTDDKGKTVSSFRIPGTRRSLGNRLRSSEADAKLPGASFLDVITPKSVAITLASMVLPELGAAWLTSGAAAFTTSAGGTLAVRAVAEMGVGFYLDTAIEKCEKGNKDKKLPASALSSSTAFLENCAGGSVDYQKLILESVVLGSVIQVAGGKTQELLEWMNWRKQRALVSDRLYIDVESALRKDPTVTEKIWKFVGDDVIGLAQETAITESFQMVSEGRDFDINTMMSTLVNNMLSRKMGKYKENLQNVIERPDVPRVIREMVENDPQVREVVMENHRRRVAEEAVIKARYEELTKNTSKPGRKVFDALLNGDLTWTETKNLYANDPDSMGMVLNEVAALREQFFVGIIERARQRSIEDVETYFVERMEQAVREAGSRESAREQLQALEARRRAELDLINAEIKTPGSKNPTSDIDRSSSSAFLRKNLIHIYEAHASWRVDGDLPTSAKAFDVNEYINVFPFITENAALVAEIKGTSTQDGMPHSNYMEAMSLSGAIQHMSRAQAENYVYGQRKIVAKAIADGHLPKKALDDFLVVQKLANDSLDASQKILFEIARDIARQENSNPLEPEIQLKAKEQLYDQRMKEIRDLQWELSELERKAGGNQKDPEAIKLRADIERKMSLAMRDGIETYSYTVGLDIIVNRVQASEKVPVLNDDGTPLMKDGEPVMRNKSVADRLMEPDFRIGEGGELHMYTEQDMRSVLNDQVMFIAEHINHFNSGHESTYLAGRGIGKYTERAFLAMKVMGLDIAKVRSRNENDPARRLLEVSQKMAELKNDPQGMNEFLAETARKEPKTPENGLAEVMFLLERVVPGMEGLSGVVPRRQEAQIEIVQPIGLNPYARPARNKATEREIQRLNMLTTGVGAGVAKDYLDQEIRFTEIEIAAVEKEIKAMQDIAAQYRLLDWDKIRKLKDQVVGLTLQRQSLLWNTHESAVSAQVKRALGTVEQQLERAHTEKIDGDIHAILYNDPATWAYRRTWHRLDWLRYRLEWLRSKLAGSAEKAQKEEVLAGLNLSGAWSCGKGQRHDFDVNLVHTDDGLTGDIREAAESGPGSRRTLAADYLRGVMSGFWEDASKPTESLDLPVEAGSTRMMFKAVTDVDGQRFQFSYGPRHPRIDLELQDVICERGKRTAAEQLEFLAFQLLPVPAPQESAWKLESGEGWVRAMRLGSSGEKSLTDFVLLKGRQRVKSARGTRVRVAAGSYTMVVRLGGRQARQNVTVSAGKLNELQLNASTMTVRSVTPYGDPLPVGFKIYDPADEARQGILVEGQSGDTIALTPGSYTVLVGEMLSFPLVMNVTLAPGETLDLEAQWKTITLPDVNRVGGSEYVQLRKQVEGADSNAWRSVAAPLLKQTDEGALVYVPDGTYSARLLPDRIIPDLVAR